MKYLLILYSYHHMNTEKVAKVFAKVLDAQITTPQQINPKELQKYSLVSWQVSLVTFIYSIHHSRYYDRNTSIQ